jgi:hypothetical protein
VHELLHVLPRNSGDWQMAKKRNYVTVDAATVAHESSGLFGSTISHQQTAGIRVGKVLRT